MRSTAFLVAELAALLVGVAFLVDLLQQRLGPDRLKRWMGGRPIVAALKGIGLGFVTPFCTYSAIPMLVGLRRAGVPPAGYVAFIVAAPVLDPVLFGALVLIIGLDVAVLYLLVAFAAAVTLALIAERIDLERHLAPIDVPTETTVPVGLGAHQVPGPPAADDGEIPCCDTREPEPWPGWRVAMRGSLANALGLLRSVWWLIALGVAIGLAIEHAVPPETVAGLTSGAGPFALPAAAALGTPLYFSTELFVPIADSLRTVGVGSGPIVALTIAGAGANVPEFVILSKWARGRVVAIFIGYVFLVAVVGGSLAAGLG